MKMLIVDSYAVAESDSEKSCGPFTHFSPKVAYCNTIVYYHNSVVGVDKIYLSYSDVPSFIACVCVCVCVWCIGFYVVLSRLYLSLQSRS